MTNGTDNKEPVETAESKSATSEIEKILSKHRENLMRYPNVNGVGIRQEDAPRSSKYIQVYVDKKLPIEKLASKDILPQELDGFKVQVKEIGNITLE